MLLFNRNSYSVILIDEMEGLFVLEGKKPDLCQMATPVPEGIFQKIVKDTGQERICIQFKITEFGMNINIMSR
jgi:hypothetical protein